MQWLVELLPWKSRQCFWFSKYQQPSYDNFSKAVTFVSTLYVEFPDNQQKKTGMIRMYKNFVTREEEVKKILFEKQKPGFVIVCLFLNQLVLICFPTNKWQGTLLSDWLEKVCKIQTVEQLQFQWGSIYYGNTGS